jgi:hypothetical protein
VTLADTGPLNAEAQDESQGNVVLVFPAPVTARYLRVDLTDGAASYMDIGLLYPSGEPHLPFQVKPLSSVLMDDLKVAHKYGGDDGARDNFWR